MASLILPATLAPTNLHLRQTTQTAVVESDVFDIARRVREVSDRLYILQMAEGDNHVWAIMEKCDDGVERLVFKTDALDARVVEKLRYMMAVPFDQRFAEAERMEYKLNEEKREDELEELYERLGAPMWRELEQCGFIQRPKSYAKRGINFS